METEIEKFIEESVEKRLKEPQKFYNPERFKPSKNLRVKSIELTECKPQFGSDADGRNRIHGSPSEDRCSA